MADYIKLTGLTGQIPSSIAPKGDMVPYEKPTVVDEYLNRAKGDGVIVLKAQIDAHAGRGLQHEWVAYKITGSNQEQIIRDCAYQLEFKHGKRIEMNAIELYKQNQSKKK